MSGDKAVCVEIDGQHRVEIGDSDTMALASHIVRACGYWIDDAPGSIRETAGEIIFRVGRRRGSRRVGRVVSS